MADLTPETIRLAKALVAELAKGADRAKYCCEAHMQDDVLCVAVQSLITLHRADVAGGHQMGSAHACYATIKAAGMMVGLGLLEPTPLEQLRAHTSASAAFTEGLGQGLHASLGQTVGNA